jgi:hypothetical protein
MKKRRKAYSVDAMMRFFLQYYNIPTKQDIEKILRRIDRLESALRSNAFPPSGARKRSDGKGAEKGNPAAGSTRMTATEKVISIIKRAPGGIDVAGLKTESGFEDKKIRNIVFRLSKEGIIHRIGRGVYSIK